MTGDSQVLLRPADWSTYFLLWQHAHMGTAVNSWDKSTKYKSFIPDRIEWFGFRPGSDLENRVACALASYLLAPALNVPIQQEYPIGRYKADFCLLDQRVVIEVDGIYHKHEACIEKDERRDIYFADNGWTVHRIDCTSGDPDVKETIPTQVAEIVGPLVESLGPPGSSLPPEFYLHADLLTDHNFVMQRKREQDEVYKKTGKHPCIPDGTEL